MEALALLCTLHADGPATLNRLRRAGCKSLDELEALEVEELADMIDVTPAVARRLEKEARLLGARIGTGILDREEAPENLAPAADLDAPRVAVGGTLDSRDRELLGKVLERWRDADSGAPEPIVAPIDDAYVEEEDEEELEALPAGCVEGLDEDLALALAELGIVTLSDLAESDPLELVRECELPFAQVQRLRFLARRAAAAEVEVEDAEDGSTELAEPTADDSMSLADPEPAFEPDPSLEDVGPAVAFDPKRQVTTLSKPRVHEPWRMPARPVPTPAEPPAEPEGTTLDWNFEIPPPPRRSSVDSDEVGGPFA